MSFCFFGLFLAPLSAQTSSISGTVLDAEARYPLTYAPDESDDSEAKDYREEYQLGFLPIFFYRVDF